MLHSETKWKVTWGDSIWLNGVKMQLHRETTANQVGQWAFAGPVQLTQQFQVAQWHENMLTPWEMCCQHWCFCCCSWGCSLQTTFMLESAIILKLGCDDICRNDEHHLTCARLRLNGTTLLVRPTVIHNLENAHTWQTSLIAFWGAGRTSHWFSSHASHYSRGLTHSCELPYTERDLCANNMTVHFSPSSVNRFLQISWIMNVTHTELTDLEQENRLFKWQRPVQSTINDDEYTNEIVLWDNLTSKKAEKRLLFAFGLVY